TADDCDLVRRWRSAGENPSEAQAGEAPQDRAVIVVNTTFRLAPWADALFAMDENWWKHHHEEVAATFSGRRTSTNQYLRRWGVDGVSIPGGGYGDSGAAAIALALLGGAERVDRLGCGSQSAGGLNHWHGPHPAGLGNAPGLPFWRQQFALLAKHAGGKVTNCSRDTALTCFPRVELEHALE